MEHAILIPSYCPDDELISLVQKLMDQMFMAITVVDDGSGKKNKRIFDEVRALGCEVVSYPENRGKGTAIKKGIEETILRFPEVRGIITADSDGQHAVEDICKISDDMNKNPYTLIMGSRDFSEKTVPWKSKLGNRFFSKYFYLNTHMICPDTQTGLRGIPSCMFEMALDAEGERYEYEMNFLTDVAKEKMPIFQIPIHTIYVNKNQCSHFHVIKDSVRIYKKPLKYICASLAGAGIDVGLFTIIVSIGAGNGTVQIMTATITARVCAGAVNFWLNKKWSFNREGMTRTQAIKYGMLFLFQMIVSGIVVSIFNTLPIPTTFIKILVDTGLFVFSYFVQNNWVFTEDKQIEKQKTSGKVHL